MLLCMYVSIYFYFAHVITIITLISFISLYFFANHFRGPLFRCFFFFVIFSGDEMYEEQGKLSSGVLVATVDAAAVM